MIHLQTIRIGEKQYPFFHNNDDDARYLHDEDGDLVLVIDSGLNVKGRDGKFGDIQSERDKWVLYYGPNRTRFDLDVSVHTLTRRHCWEQLEAAEVAVCQFYIKNTSLPKFKRAEETEGGSCD